MKQLTNQEINELLKKYYDGDNDAKKKIIESNLELVYYVINKKYKNVSPKNELFQEGCIGLIKSVDKYNNKYGLKYSSFATLYIDYYIKNYLKRRNLKFSFSNEYAKDIGYLRTVIYNFKEKYQYMPSIEELSSITKYNKEYINIIINSYNIESIENLEEEYLNKYYTFEENLINKLDNNNRVKDILNSLTPTQRKYIEYIAGLYDGIEHNLTETAHFYNVTPQNIHKTINLIKTKFKKEKELL